MQQIIHLPAISNAQLAPQVVSAQPTAQQQNGNPILQVISKIGSFTLCKLTGRVLYSVTGMSNFQSSLDAYRKGKSINKDSIKPAETLALRDHTGVITVTVDCPPRYWTEQEIAEKKAKHKEKTFNDAINGGTRLALSSIVSYYTYKTVTAPNFFKDLRSSIANQCDWISTKDGESIMENMSLAIDQLEATTEKVFNYFTADLIERPASTVTRNVTAVTAYLSLRFLFNAYNLSRTYTVEASKPKKKGFWDHVAQYANPQQQQSQHRLNTNRTVTTICNEKEVNGSPVPLALSTYQQHTFATNDKIHIVFGDSNILTTQQTNNVVVTRTREEKRSFYQIQRIIYGLAGVTMGSLSYYLGRTYGENPAGDSSLTSTMGPIIQSLPMAILGTEAILNKKLRVPFVLSAVSAGLGYGAYQQGSSTAGLGCGAAALAVAGYGVYKYSLLKPVVSACKTIKKHPLVTTAAGIFGLAVATGTILGPKMAGFFLGSQINKSSAV